MKQIKKMNKKLIINGHSIVTIQGLMAPMSTEETVKALNFKEINIELD